jgi:exonuclease III
MSNSSNKITRKVTQSAVNNDYQHCSITELASTLDDSNYSFSLLHVNIRSIQKNIDKLVQLVYDLGTSPDIIGLSETWVTQSSFFKPCLPSYRYVFQPSTKRAGGVSFFIKDDIDFIIRDDLHFKSLLCENLWIETTTKQGKKLIFGVVYRQHDNNYSDFCQHFELALFNLNLSNSSYCICGDFNIDYLKQNTRSYRDLVLSLGSEQLIKSSTHLNRNSNTASLIDHIYSNLSSAQVDTKVLIHDITDHFPTIALINAHSLTKKIPNNLKFRDYRKFDQNKFLADLSNNLPFYQDEESNPNNFFDTFFTRFMNVVNRHAPFRSPTKKAKKHQTKPWITNQLLRMIKTKNHLYHKYVKRKNEENLRAYKKISNTIRYGLYTEMKVKVGPVHAELGLN